MTHPRFTIAASIGLIILLIGGGCFGVLASLWLPWQLVASGDVKLAWTRRAAAVIPASGVLPPELHHVLKTTWRGVYLQQHDGRMLLVVPTLRYQRATPALLAAAGWHVQRFGPYIYAMHGEPGSPLVALRDLARGLGTTLVTSRWPLYPSVILEMAALNTVTQTPLVAVAVHAGNTWRVVVDQSLHTPAIARNTTDVLPTPDSTAIVVGAPGALWGSMPETLWDDSVRPALHFTATRPQIVRTLTTLPHAAVTLAPAGGVAITAEDPSEQFALAATTWLQEEERRTRLVNRVFRLPDRTIGYEKVPGEVLPVLGPPDEVGCKSPIEGRATLWLCHQGTYTTLATDRALALAESARRSSLPLHIEIGVASMRSLQKECPASDPLGQVVCRVRAISWDGNENFHIGAIEFNDQ